MWFGISWLQFVRNLPISECDLQLNGVLSCIFCLIFSLSLSLLCLFLQTSDSEYRNRNCLTASFSPSTGSRPEKWTTGLQDCLSITNSFWTPSKRDLTSQIICSGLLTLESMITSRAGILETNLVYVCKLDYMGESLMWTEPNSFFCRTCVDFHSSSCCLCGRPFSRNKEFGMLTV